MIKVLICTLLLACQYSAWAELVLSGPLLTDSMVVEISTSTEVVVRGTPCFTTTAPVTECRRKRGFQEKAIIFKPDQSSADINPSAILAVEATPAPRSLNLNKPKFNSETVLSSIDETYYDSYKFFRQIASIAGRQSGNMLTISSEGCSGPVDFSKFLSCIGLTVQNTDTETRVVTTTTTTTSGFSTIFLAGCTPPFFPYPLCTAAADPPVDPPAVKVF